MHDLLKSARDGNRTRTDITAHRILSPACLPIPPPRHPSKNVRNKGAKIQLFSI